LSAQGVNAIASYKVFGSGKLPDKKAIMSKMDELNMEVVLITNIVDKERQRVYEKTWHNYSTYLYRTRYKTSTMRYIDYDYHVETELYDVRCVGAPALIDYSLISKCDRDGLIWSALSETLVLDKVVQSDVKEIEKFINVMVKKLSDDGMLKQY
jgi:hypothetical protein